MRALRDTNRQLASLPLNNDNEIVARKHLVELPLQLFREKTFNLFLDQCFASLIYFMLYDSFASKLSHNQIHTIQAHVSYGQRWFYTELL